MEKEKEKEKENVGSNKVNKDLVEQKTVEFDALNSVIVNKQYKLSLDADAVDGLLDFFEFVEWKGYECYGVEKLYDAIVPQLHEYGEEGENLFKLEMDVEAEMVEAMFYFIKSYSSSGIERARSFRKMADAFAVPMQDINIDRKALRDAALELQAAESGMTVEEIVGENTQS